MTVYEYLQTPETTLPQELVYGHLRAAEAPLVNHQRAVFAIARALQDHVASIGLGEVLLAPVDVILDADRHLVVQPDVLFVSAARAHIVTDRIDGAPDLVIEVLSPDPRIGQLTERVEWFARYGVREMWLYRQPERRMEVLQCAGGRVTGRDAFEGHDAVRSAVLPRLDLSVAEIVGY